MPSRRCRLTRARWRCAASDCPTTGTARPRLVGRPGLDDKAHHAIIDSQRANQIPAHQIAAAGDSGQVDAAFNWWNDENESMLRRMERKSMAKYDDFRIIFKSNQAKTAKE